MHARRSKACRGSLRGRNEPHQLLRDVDHISGGNLGRLKGVQIPGRNEAAAGRGESSFEHTFCCLADGFTT